LFKFNFVEPIWFNSENITLSTPPLKHVEGLTNETEIFIGMTLFSFFRLKLVTLHTNLYLLQKYIKKKKSVRTDHI